MVAFFEKYFRLQIENKTSVEDIIFIQLLKWWNYNTKTNFYMEERLFELLYNENHFAKYFAKFLNLFI